MTRSHGRCRNGERLRMGFSHGHRKTTTLVAGLSMTGIVAPLVLDGSKRLLHPYASLRHTVPTSTRLRRPSPGSKSGFARPANEPSADYGT